jgi:hypothetical protein
LVSKRRDNDGRQELRSTPYKQEIDPWSYSALYFYCVCVKWALVCLEILGHKNKSPRLEIKKFKLLTFSLNSL